MIPGRATRDGGKRFAGRSSAATDHFRDAGFWLLSSIGVGSYLGGEDAATDEGYSATVGAALSSGVNVFDSAINYRGQKSERAIGRGIARAIETGLAVREEIFVSTKGGYLPHDADDPRPPRQYVKETFVESGLAPPEEIVGGVHCMARQYLVDQIDRSRKNMDLETIDLYYLHNVGSQLEEVDRTAFRDRLAGAIETLEWAVAEGKIAAWGLATWNELRCPPQHPEHVSLAEVRRLAEELAGSGHHFAAVQLPVNLAMTEAIAYRSQPTEDGLLPALAAARSFGLAAFGSASLLQGRLAADLPEEIVEAFPEAQTGAQRALQFARSAPGMTTSLVGVANLQHARENFALAMSSPAEETRMLSLFG